MSNDASSIADALADAIATSDPVADHADGGGGLGVSQSPGGTQSGEAGSDAPEGPRVQWHAEYAGMPMAMAISAARGEYVQRVIDSKRNESGRITVEERCRIVRIICVAWMRTNGEFYVDRDNLSAGSAIYHYRRGGRWYRMASEEFASWFVESIGMEPTSREVVNAQKALAMASVNSRIVNVVAYQRYFASLNGVCYVSNGEDEVIAVSPDGIVRQRNGLNGVFFAPDSVLPKWQLLPVGQEVDPLEATLYGSMASVEGERSRTLLKLWLCTLPINPPTKPLLVFVGGVGSGKTKTATGVFRVLGIDTRTCDFTRDSRLDDFWTAVNRGGCLTIDNVDARIPWLPGSLASASTGGSMETRKLYSDNEVVVRRSQAWIVITTASPQFAQDAGCADRILKIELYRRDEPTSDSALDADITAKRDGILSYIVRAIRSAMLVSATPPDGLNRRHPDWAAWAWRIGYALGIREAAEEALFGAEDDKSLFTIVSDEAFGLPFVRYMDSLFSEWEGDASMLLSSMQSAQILSPDDARHLSPRIIGRRIGASWPFYRRVFGATKRISSGRVIYRFVPRRVRQAEVDGVCGGLDAADSNSFNNELKNNYENSEMGQSNPPYTPTGTSDYDPYDPAYGDE